MSLNVNEIFYSVQGEGPYAGKAAVFLRLTGCNLKCSYCDTPYAFKEGEKMLVADVAKQILNYNPVRVVITGGEPLIQQKNLVELVDILFCNDVDIMFETNGTIPLSKKMMLYSPLTYIVSPKLSSSGKATELAESFILKIDNPNDIYYKFVIGSEQDLNEMEEFMRTYEINFICSKVYLMPEGQTSEEINAKFPLLFEYAKGHPFVTITPRLHISAFGKKRGV